VFLVAFGILAGRTQATGFVSNSNGQTGHAWGRCERFATSGGDCDSFLGGRFVWVYGPSMGASAVSQADLLADIGDGLSNVEESTDSGPDTGCKNIWTELMCLSALPPCFIDSRDGFEAPQQICISACNHLRDVCSRAFYHLKQGSKAQFHPKCNQAFASPESLQTFMDVNFLEQWRGIPHFVDGFTSVQDQSGSWHDFPCWGEHLANYYSDDAFWNDEYVDDEEFEERCEDSGGEFVLHNDGFVECIYKTRENCVQNGGDWISVDESNNGVKFECFLPYRDSFDYDSSEEAWEIPAITFHQSSVEISPGVWNVPLEVIIHCAEGAEILFSYGSFPKGSQCGRACVPEASRANFDAGTVDLFPNGKRFTFIDEGRHVLRMRTVGRGRAPSQEFGLRVDTVRQKLLPPDNSEQVYVRTEVEMMVASPSIFDVFLFRLAVVAAILQGTEGLILEIDDVQVFEVSTAFVRFEVRVENEPERLIVADRILDPLFVYPLAEHLFANGLLNATDQCSAKSLIRVDNSQYETLRGAVSKSNMGTIATVVGVVMTCVVAVAVIVIRRKSSQLKDREKKIFQHEAVVDKKAADLDLRERELASKLKQIEEQEQHLLSEKQALDNEKEELEQEAIEAQLEVEKLEHEELVALDPETAEDIEAEQDAFDAELVREIEDKIEQFAGRFKEAVAPEEIREARVRLRGIFGNGKLAFLKRVPRKLVRIIGDSDISRLKAEQGKMSSIPDRELYVKLIDELVEKGALHDIASDPKERLKQEYEDAMYRLQSDVIDKKKQHRERLAQRRKQQLNLVIEDAQAVSEGNAPVEGTILAKEALRGIDEEFEREKERIKAEVPSQDEFELAMAKLEDKKKQQREEKLLALELRREKARQRLQTNPQKLEKERQAAEEKQRLIASKVSKVFKKISSVDSKVSKLKEDHQNAQAQLKREIAGERARQREKLAKRKANASKIAPSDG